MYLNTKLRTGIEEVRNGGYISSRYWAAFPDDLSSAVGSAGYHIANTLYNHKGCSAQVTTACGLVIARNGYVHPARS